MNLWKLWIARGLLQVLPVTCPVCRPCHHEFMDDTAVPETVIIDLPTSFGGEVVLLDVREDDEWRRGHAPGAQHIPMGDVPARMAEIDADAELYVICLAGGRSQRVAQYLARNGYEAANIVGGMLAWARSGRPVVTEEGGVGTL